MNRFTVITAVIIITSSPTPSGKSIAQMTVKGGSDAIKDIFKGGSDSIVAIAVGHAEGTRTANGSKTSAYYGHEDPADKHWNKGWCSFSVRRSGIEVKNPEEADKVCEQKIKKADNDIRYAASQNGLELTFEERIQLIDLCNQSPEACLGWSDGANPGAIVLLKEFKEKGVDDPLLKARVEAFRNQYTGVVEAFTSDMTPDQERRMLAIKRVLELRDKFGGR